VRFGAYSITVRKENYMRFAEGERRQITEISVVRAFRDL
jgi:hypothetical protein